MLRIITACLSSLAFCALGFAAENYPPYQEQPCSLVQARSGIGNVISKLKSGQDISVAYFGGSITAANGWRPKTTVWLKSQYPNANITEIHAAIGGTGSDLGVFRCQHDVLDFHPDLVFVEFSVNDGGAAPESIWRQMEGIVRQIWKANPQTDIVFVYTFIKNFDETTLSGKCVRSSSAMEQLAQFYAIPSINFCPRIAQMQKEGTLVVKDEGDVKPGQIIFSGDNVHPTDAGHELYLKDVQLAWQAMENLPPVNHQAELDKTFVADNYQNACMIPLEEKWLSGSWKKLESTDSLFWATKRAGDIWTSGTPGDSLTFKVKASQVKIYDLLAPNGGQVFISIDGKTAEKPVPQFDSYCTYYRLGTTWIGQFDSQSEHTITITIDKNQPDRRSIAFRLQDPEKELSEPKYQGTNVWFGSILIIGEIVK